MRCNTCPLKDIMRTRSPRQILDPAGGFAPDPFTGAFWGFQQSLFLYHPTHRIAMFLWNTHIQSVEPLCKVLHIPSSTKMVMEVSQEPGTAQLAHKIIDTDIAAYAHAGLERYQWHARSVFAYGSWDSLIYVMASLRRPGLLSNDEADDSWNKVEQVDSNNGDSLESKQALHIAFESLTLKAWVTSPPTNSSSVSEPGFNNSLRSRQKVNLATRTAADGSRAANACPQHADILSQAP